jgi:hypothetical protein
MGEGRPIVFGARYSVYVWIIRLALEEKGVPYRLVPVVCGRRPTLGIRGGADGGQRCSGECGRLRKVLAGSRYEIVNHPTISYELIVVEAETTAHR